MRRTLQMDQPLAGDGRHVQVEAAQALDPAQVPERVVGDGAAVKVDDGEIVGEPWAEPLEWTILAMRVRTPAEFLAVAP